MMETIKVKPERIKALIGDRVAAKAFSDRRAVAAAIFESWRKESKSISANWCHGVGKKSGSTTPDPLQANPYGSLLRYVDGRTPQNRRGWEMVADVLGASLDEIIDTTHASTMSGVLPSAGAVTHGPAVLTRLANIDVFKPAPHAGANAVFPEPERKQAISLSMRAIFNTIRNEELVSDGVLLATADIELSHAYIVLAVSDADMVVLDAIGMGGKRQLDSLTVSYLGSENGCVLFELACAPDVESLGGIAQLLENFLQLEGRFVHTDFLGSAFDQNAIRLLNVGFEQQPEEPSEPYKLRQALKSQVLRQGLEFQSSEAPLNGKRLTSKRFFMTSVRDDLE